MINMVQDLFLELATTTEQLDFPIVYASAKQGYCTDDLEKPSDDMTPLLETIIRYVPAPSGNINSPLQMLVAALDYDNHLGQIAIGRIFRGFTKQKDSGFLKSRGKENQH